MLSKKKVKPKIKTAVKKIDKTRQVFVVEVKRPKKNFELFEVYVDQKAANARSRLLNYPSRYFYGTYTSVYRVRKYTPMS